MANRLGDSTAKLLGRLSLNPMVHIDWIGTVLFPFLMFVIPQFMFFGWAKPVPINPRYIKGRYGTLWVALAGPASNLLLAVLFALLFRVVIPYVNPLALSEETLRTLKIVFEMIETGVFLNLTLAFFNLIPIPPLDGSQILASLLPYRYQYIVDALRQYGSMVLLLLLWTGGLRIVHIPVLWMAQFLLP